MSWLLHLPPLKKAYDEGFNDARNPPFDYQEELDIVRKVSSNRQNILIELAYLVNDDGPGARYRMKELLKPYREYDEE